MTSEPRELRGRDAEAYAKEHLKQIRVDPETWEVEYVDPETGLVWILDYPDGEAHGGGEPRLRMQDMSVGSDVTTLEGTTQVLPRTSGIGQL